MFGGAGILSDGTMFGILHKGRAYLKTDERTRAAFVDAGPFRATRNLVLKTYYELPLSCSTTMSNFLPGPAARSRSPKRLPPKRKAPLR